MRQTNHNGRVNANTGKAYSRKHNDRQYDIEEAENINASMTAQNIIIHYDVNNQPHIIDNHSRDRKSIDEHEHEMYAALFGDSLKAQHQRNESARHPERNKTIDNLLDNKFTCPEETIFQLGSLEDGYPPPEVLMEIFEAYQKEVIALYGKNIHFLDATLHLDESVPHIHVRKVWTYHGKDGIDISQNKALDEMGFERPNPEKKTNKWNNAKITFTAWERDLKLSLCERQCLEIEREPEAPGKASMTKEEMVTKKLIQKNHTLRKKNIDLADEIDEKEKELKSIKTIIKEKIMGFIQNLKACIFEHFDGHHQREALDAMWSVPIDKAASDKLKALGYRDCWEGQSVGLMLYEAEQRDIREALKKASEEKGDPNLTDSFRVYDMLENGASIEDAIEQLAEETSQAVQKIRRHR